MKTILPGSQRICSPRRATNRPRSTSIALFLLLTILALLPTLGRGQTIAPPFASDYSILDLGSVPGVPPLYGGITFRARDPNTLLIGGGANVAAGAIYAIGVIRDANSHIIGFSNSASFYASAPYNDGGLAYGPGGVLFYTAYPSNEMGEIKEGSSSPDRIIDLSLFDIVSSVGTLQFVPEGFPDVGGIRIASYNGGGFYSGTLVPDGNGTFDLANVALRSVTGFGPEGIVYVPPGAPVFTGSSMLISEYNANRVSAYTLDAAGIPVPASQQDFIVALEGAQGAVLDPLTNDFLFSTFGGGDHVLVVRGFGAPPALTLTGAVSRKIHGSAGAFDLPLNLASENATIEPRSGGPSTVVFAFSDSVVATDGSIDANEFGITNAHFSAASISDNQVTLELTDVVDQSIVAITLQGLSSTGGVPLGGNKTVAIGALVADADQSGIVDPADRTTLRAHKNEPVDDTNFVFDIDLNGVIGQGDAHLVRVNKYHSLP